MDLDLDIIKIDLERSNYYNKRKELLNSSETPTLTDARERLGSPLSDVVFKQCDEALQVPFGLKPILKGPGNTLWVSPSDLLIGKVCLKPPLTSKHIQALTHQGIIDIGSGIERKFWKEMELATEDALENQKTEMLTDFEAELKSVAKKVELQERSICDSRIDTLTKEFEVTLLDELNALETRLKKEFEEENLNHANIIHGGWKKKLNNEISGTVKSMTKKFLRDLKKQEMLLKCEYAHDLQKAEIRKEFELEVERAHCQVALKQLRHSLECKNIANMMYVLCMERRKCSKEIKIIETKYETEIEKLEDRNKELEDELQNFTEEVKKKSLDLQLRELCLVEIIRQFQKFINFALRSAPTQAEFLLSVDKMMVFDLTEAAMMSEVRKIRTPDHLCNWPYEPRTPCLSHRELAINDHHDCLNEVEIERKKNEEYKHSDFLPAFKLNNHLYVREDFRNMLSQGLKIRPSNEIWNKDVEILMETLQESVSEESEDERNSKSNVKFSIKLFNSADDTHMISDHLKKKRHDCATNSKPLMKNSIDTLNSIKYSRIGSEERRNTLLGSRNSVELIRHRLSKAEDDDQTDAKSVDEDVCAAPEAPRISEVLQLSLRGSKRHSEISDTLATDGRVPSKLVLARDSIMIHRESLIRKKSIEFTATPRDSLELKRNNYRIGSPSPDQSNTSGGCRPIICTEVCSKRRRSLEMVDGVPTSSHKKKDQFLSAAESTVSFDLTPIVRESGRNADDLMKLYVPKPKPVKTKKIVKKPKDLTISNKLEIVGDKNAKEHLQNTDDFTMDRIHSLVDMIKNQPDLIRLFTTGMQ